MVKKSAVILGILAIMVLSVGISWGYTVAKWPVPGIPNTVYCGGPSCLPGCPDDYMLKGPVAPGCECALIPGVIHAALSIPYRALALPLTPAFTGQFCPQGCCPVDLGEPAYVTAAVPCTPVNIYVPPKGW
ncbi:MAG: hypothetical protein HY913_19120 [Desulfomonile tiedjei]|nr:hypothetical protein [Desulfomonile tiedjei]